MPVAEGRHVQCRLHLVDENGGLLEPREEPITDSPCAYLCGDRCVRESGPPEGAIRIASQWHRCGGAERRFLPSTGAINDQQAADVYWLDFCDSLYERAMNERAKQYRAAAAATGKRDAGSRGTAANQ